MLSRARPYMVMAAMALVQLSIFDEVLLLGIGHMPVTLWAVVAAALRRPPVEAIKLGFAAGLFSDVLGASHLGRQAFTFCLIAWAVSTVAPRMITASSKVGWLERSILIVLFTVFSWVVGTVMGLPFPIVSGLVAVGVLASAGLGGLVSGPRRGLGFFFATEQVRLHKTVPLVPARVTLEAEAA